LPPVFRKKEPNFNSSRIAWWKSGPVVLDKRTPSEGKKIPGHGQRWGLPKSFGQKKILFLTNGLPGPLNGGRFLQESGGEGKKKQVTVQDKKNP